MSDMAMVYRSLGVLLLFCVVHSAAAQVAVTFINATTPSADLSRPHDLTLDPSGGRLYVADMDNDVIKVFDPRSLKLLGVIGRGLLNSPHDVFFDGAGRLLVADSGNDRIAVFTVHDGGASYQGELRRGFGSPEGVAVDRAGAMYVTNAALHTVLAFARGGAYPTARAGGQGRGPGRFIRPHDIEVGPDGLVYVADPGNNRIQVLDPGLHFVRAISGGFREPKYLALDEGGWLYVADQDNHQVKVFDAQGRRLATIGSGQPGRLRHQLNRPEGVEVRGEHLWIADTYNDRIVHFRMARTR